jgi:hypothetical protein
MIRVDYPGFDSRGGEKKICQFWRHFHSGSGENVKEASYYDRRDCYFGLRKLHRLKQLKWLLANCLQ